MGLDIPNPIWTKSEDAFLKLVSLLGLVVLLGLAWAISYHRRQVNPLQIIWGIGLQVVFALIILRGDLWSFIGMCILALLLVFFSFRMEWKPRPGATESANEPGRPGIMQGALLTLSLALGVTICTLGVRTGWPMGWLSGLVLLGILLRGWLNVGKRFHPYLFTLLVCSAVGYLIGHDIHGVDLFKGFSDGVARFLNLSDYGAQFLFGNLASERYFFPGSEGFPNQGTWPGFGFLFAFKVLPTIIFFGGLMGVLYYLGVMQKVIVAMAKFMRWTIGTSGAETLSCSANVFVGQTEAPLLIKPFLSTMTSSELLTIMVGGFATIAGGVLAGYIAMGVDAGHLVAASVMSAPAALVIGKIIYPELETSLTAGDVRLPEIPVGRNVLEAASGGISDGLKLAVNVGAMLIGFIALIAVVDYGLNAMDRLIDGHLLGGVYYEYGKVGFSPAHGEFAGWFPGSLRTFFGTVLKPLAWVMGVPWKDCTDVGNLLGIKLSLNEFVAYGALGTYINEAALDERSLIIATYALCGFANFSSIGIQLGGISALAPERRSELARIALKAMIGGALASWTTATIAGLFL